MQENSFSPFAGGSDISESDLDTLLPDYLIITEQRKDAFGIVFKARNRKRQKVVSIRILPISASQFPGGQEAFIQYAGVLPQFQHPNLAEISDYGATEAGHLYLVTTAGEKEAGKNGTVLRALFDEKGHEKPGGSSELKCEKNKPIPAGNFDSTSGKSETPSTRSTQNFT